MCFNVSIKELHKILQVLDDVTTIAGSQMTVFKWQVPITLKSLPVQC